MNSYEVTLAIARGKQFDTGQRLTALVIAADPLDGAIRAEEMMDRLLPNPDVEYTHTCGIKPVTSARMKAALAA